MINVRDFRECVVTPTLKTLDLYSVAAEQLLLGTAVHESSLIYLRQIGGGPALGFFQCEPATHSDIWQNYLGGRPALQDKVLKLAGHGELLPQLMTNLAYATAICRVHYLRVPKALPAEDDVQALAAYWKSSYNTELGAGTPPQFILSYNEHVKPLYK
jgi:hypothetical protein